MPLLEIQDLRKRFLTEEGEVPVVQVPRFELEAKSETAIQGESGSGKTTFLHLIAGILTPDAGSIRLQGESISGLPEARRDRLRACQMGYIFQTFNLLQGYTCLENVLLAMHFGRGVDRESALRLLGRVGLSHRLDYYPRQLSTGQQQRVAVARALANRPSLVLADEPTGNLDARTAGEVLQLIRDMCRENGASLLLVSHDAAVLKSFASVLDWTALNQAPTRREAP